jgi:lysozyme family protein
MISRVSVGAVDIGDLGTGLDSVSEGPDNGSRGIAEGSLRPRKNSGTFPTFGKGWMRRVNDVRVTALGMVGEEAEEVATPEQVMTGQGR